MSIEQSLPSSFRDPSGFVFQEDGLIYRQVNSQYKDEYEFLMKSGLYTDLTESGMLICHEEKEQALSNASNNSGSCYKKLLPSQIPFVSYPFEWCFSQLKDAALLTLRIQKRALEYGMSLKDASAYNVQFLEGMPIFIDTLSFEMYEEGSPWIAYKQFCEHFIAPLSLMAHCDLRMNELLQTNIDGIDLDLASKLLPKSTLFDVSLLINVHIHSKMLNKYSKAESLAAKAKETSMSKSAVLGLVDGLESLVRKLQFRKQNSDWKNYYDEHNYSKAGFESKRTSVDCFLDTVNPSSVLDLGANNGEFSRLASSKGIHTISTDMDVNAVESNYQRALKEKDDNILPLRIDLSVPTPAIGWGNSERMSFSERSNFDLVLALALIHHLAIGNNLPLSYIAEQFSKLGQYLIIEFVPKSDSQVKQMLHLREDIFTDYNQSAFESVFSRYYEIEKKSSIEDSDRTLYLMKRKP